PVRAVDALGGVGEREARAGLLETDAELFVLERAEARVEAAGGDEERARERDVAGVDVVPADLGAAGRERVRLRSEDARVEALEQRHLGELRVGTEAAEDDGPIVDVVVEV